LIFCKDFEKSEVNVILLLFYVRPNGLVILFFMEIISTLFGAASQKEDQKFKFGLVPTKY